ncbi:DUF2846 domain-containing protein [Pedobacter mucosus]|uniref:DUF2846 domain-containing protein n=1 Tax=Pedobacter mucosus TaxID=2895286 RepID=UPI001EE43CD2|nr:DUF2846 domain-containing protein [Pedobacter mucosus]UKT64695.1 DUF2846 domain-containing protein [Pedobacter mucosus]
MKSIKLSLLVSFLLMVSLPIFAQSNSGKVYLIRLTGFAGAAVNYSIYIDGKLACKLKNKSYSIQDLSVGDHSISVISGGLTNGKKSAPLKITVAADKSNYVNIVGTQSGYANSITCQEITKNSADPLLAKAKQKVDCLDGK